MRPFKLAFPEHNQAALPQENNRRQDARYDRRLHCVLLVAEGFSCEQEAGWFEDSPRSVANWVRRIDHAGLAGLSEGNHSGRPCSLSDTQLEELRNMVRQTPAQAGVAANLWDGQSLARCIQEHFQIRIGKCQCQRLFHRLGTRHRLRRPRVAQADPHRMRNWPDFADYDPQ